LLQADDSWHLVEPQLHQLQTLIVVFPEVVLQTVVEEGNLLGLRFRDLTMHETVARSFTERPYDMFGSSPWLDDAIEEFEGIVEEMLSLASFEGKFRRLAEELVRLTRRIRILEERVTPGLHVEIHAMAQYLAERERETYFRLKRFKKYASKKGEGGPGRAGTPRDNSY